MKATTTKINERAKGYTDMQTSRAILASGRTMSNMASGRSLGQADRNTKDPLSKINFMARECTFMLMEELVEENGQMTNAFSG